ncbi:hypothetical protein DH2020_036870 [Rehmannia glutinosa]|uniref:Zinc finger PHD-type domain-containing protein n=1 Tax=Rehmannia glutinosa TaxID=99300 RepID=A0ABR0V4M2_REHGL
MPLSLYLSPRHITPVLRGSFRMQGPADEANCDLLTHMLQFFAKKAIQLLDEPINYPFNFQSFGSTLDACLLFEVLHALYSILVSEAYLNNLAREVTSENSKGLSSSSDSQNVDCRGKSGTCNVCSAPCSSCFHVNKVLLKSNDESAGETCAENIEIGQLSVLSTVAGMNSTSDSLSENAVGKTSSRTSNASASDDSVVHSKSEGRRVPEGHDDCLSCVSGTDEHANKKSDTEDSMIKYNKPSKIKGESSDEVPPSSSQTGLNSQNSGFSKSTDVATDLLKFQNTSSQPSNGKYVSHDQNPRDVKDEKPSPTKDELLESSIEHRDSLSPKGVASDVVCDDPPATALNSIQNNDDMEVVFQPIDETDDSDMVEQDVKVCDICGDAGREDLLAFCCRCSDGAEHTYCMREMLAKVPEGEWLCEECQAVEHVGNGRQEKIGRVDENEKNNSGHASSEYANSSDVEGQRTKGSMRIPCKRHRDDDDVEVSSIVKKPALESILGSPRPSNSGKAAALTRENSLKSLDKGRLQSAHHSSLDTVPVNDTTESASSASDLRLHSFGGTFSKSNSFSSLNSKPKVKLVDQVVIQRQKSAKEHSSFRLKEGVTCTTGESSSLATIANHHEMKPVQADGKSAALSRSSSLAARRTADLSSSAGVFKRPSMHGGPSVSGANNIEQKYSQTSLKEDNSCSVVAERPPFNANEGIPDGLPRSGDLTNSGERMKECSGSRSGPPSVKSSRDESDNLKAAIEAAVLRKPGVYRKHRAFELPERPTVSRNLTADSIKQETSNFVKQSSLVPVEGLSSGGRDGVHISYSSRDVFSNVPAAMPFFLKSVAVPEHEYIWQGSFEVCRSGKIPDSLDGIQAHLSTCASPKVIEAVNNYDKIYKVLLDNMMKNDLALKGNVNGVELLIFPSNQLPDNSQLDEPNGFTVHILRCSLRPITVDLHGSEDAAPVLELPASEELRRLLSSRVANRDCGTKSLDQLDHRLNSSSSPAVQGDSANRCQEMRGTSQEGDVSSSCSPPLAMESSSCSGREQMLMQSDRQQLSHHASKSVAGALKEGMMKDLCWIRPMNHVPCGAYGLQNQHLVLECDESAERHFFPTESKPVEGINFAVGSTPWKMHLLEQDRVHDRAPDLELALGAERKSLTLAIQPLVGSKVEQKVKEEHVLEEAGTRAEDDDDVAASLSLSLSFPFPESTKQPAPKTEQQLVPERERVNATSMLLLAI